MTIVDKTTNHFMVVTETEFLLVDPDKTRLGWGVIHFIAFLQVEKETPICVNGIYLLYVHMCSMAIKVKLI